jgi:TPP-dependent 2-oxoacid decarboxylase
MSATLNHIGNNIRCPLPFTSAAKAPLSSQQMKPQATKSTNLLTNELLVQSIQSGGTNKNVLLDEQSSKHFNIENTQVYFSKQNNQRMLQQ